MRKTNEPVEGLTPDQAAIRRRRDIGSGAMGMMCLLSRNEELVRTTGGRIRIVGTIRQGKSVFDVAL
jgi:hypothetical protein